MLLRLFVLFTILPLLELIVLWWIAGHTSLWFAVGLVLLTAFLGATLARMQGWRTLRRIQDELRAGHAPADALLDALLIFVAGALLIAPGVLTDLLGLMLLFPPTRNWGKRRLKRRFTNRLHASPLWQIANPSQVIDAKIVPDRREEL